MVKYKNGKIRLNCARMTSAEAQFLSSITNTYEPDHPSGSWERYDEILFETEKAWALQFGCWKIWLPKSQCKIYNKYVWIPEWLKAQPR